MAVQHEDTVLGGADISGDASPVQARPPAQRMADVQRQMDHRPKPQAQGAKHLPGEDKPPKDGGDGSDPSEGGDKGKPPSPPAQDTPPPPPPERNPFAPVDWNEVHKSDPATAYHASRSTLDHLTTFLNGTGLSSLPGDAVRHVENVWSAFDDTSAISQSIQNIWGQRNAQAAIARYMLSGSPAQAFNPTQQGQQGAQLTGAVASIGANPENILGMGEGAVAARIAMVAGPQVLQALGSQNANDASANLGWAALTGMILTRGHLPAGASEQLTKSLGQWPTLEKTIKSILGMHGGYRVDMAAGAQAAKGAIQDYFKRGGVATKETMIAKAVPARGEYVAKGRGREAALKAAGVTSVPELLQKAATDGISDKKEIDAVVQHAQDLGLRYDIQRVREGDVALGNPFTTLHELHSLGDPPRTAAYLESMDALEGFLGHVQSGLWAAHADPEHAAQALLTNLAGHNRRGGSTELLYNGVTDAWERLMSTHGISGEAISKAVTGDKAAFDALPPEGQGIARQWRVLGNAIMHESAGVKYTEDFTGNWLPFRFQKADTLAPRRGAGGRVGAFTSASKAHKSEALKADAEGRLTLTKQYDSPQQANADFSNMRQTLVGELTNPGTELRDELSKVKWAKDIKALAETNPEEALTQAQQKAREYYPFFETDFLKIARQWNASGLKALRSHQALQIMGESLAKDGEPLAKVIGDEHERATWESMGYKSLPGRQYQNYLFHPDFHPNIERYVDHARKGLQDAEGFKQLLQLEGKSVAAIMFSPPIHLMNMAARFGAAWTMNPIELTRYLVHGKGFSPMQRDVESNLIRKFSIEAGGIPPTRGGHSMFDNLSARGNDSLAHIDGEMEKIERDAPNVAQRFMHSHKMLNDWIWNHYRDFGTMMTHLEYIAARKHGYSDTEAKLWAGRRGASWTGLSNPENQSPALHDAMRGIALAPGYWMSFAQLMVPIYRRAGMGPKDAAYIAYQGAKFIAAAWAFQHLTGNLANYALTSSTPWAHDGHFQNENLPGNQDRIEATAPWLDHVPGFASVASEVSKTGGRRTIENPLGRQMRDLETVAGLETGQKDWRPGDVRDGITKVAVARFSPLMDGLAAAVNVDPYRTATTGDIAHIDPSQPIGLSPTSPLYAMLMLTPMGSQYAEQVAASMAKPDAMSPTKGPFGLTVPKAMQDVVGNSKTAAERLLYTWGTGTNAPYDYAAKSRGTPVSDQAYGKWAHARDTYHSEMTAASTRALGGEMTPSEYLNGTKDGKWQGAKKATATYQAISQSTFHDAPHYVNGAEGLLAEYESLYDQAADPAGGVDYAKLDRLQAAFRTKHANDPVMGQMQQILQQNDTRIPMQGLYHKTVAAYGKWQETYAQQHGVDVNTLRQEASEYSALYGNRAGSAKYLADHRALQAYEIAKRTQFETSPSGLMYGLFYDSSIVARYMQAHHLTTQQVEQEAEAQP